MTGSLAWLGAFVGAVLVGGDVVIRATSPFLASRLELDPFSLSTLGAVILGDLTVSLAVTFLVCAALRAIRGRLTGLEVGGVSVVVVAAHILFLSGGVFVPFNARVYYVFLAAKLFVATALGAIPWLRHRALELSPPSRFRGLGGTYAFSAPASEVPSVAIGRRHARAWHRTLRRAKRPDHWDQTITSSTPASRLAPRDLALALLFLDGVAAAWAALLAGAAAAVVCLLASRTWLANDLAPEPAVAESPWPIVLPVLAIGLLSFGAAALRERVHLLRLLRDGQLVHALPAGDVLPGPPPVSVTSVVHDGYQLIVMTPAPLHAGARQALLIGPRGDVAAWDLLPHRSTGHGA